jgi:hypothetical protein
MKLFYRALILLSALWGAAGLVGCAASSAPASAPQSTGGASSSVTVYGTVDGGVGRVSR